MKKRFLISLALIALLMLGLCSTALAAEPITVNMELSSYRFSGPEEVTVTIRVTNTSDADMPGAVLLYDPNGARVTDFGAPVLAAGQSVTWTGTWTVTEKQIAEGRIFYAVLYPVVGSDGTQVTKQVNYFREIEDADAVAQVSINRYIVPSIASKGQKVSVIYEVSNTGTIDVTDFVIRESSTVSKTNGKIDLIKAGEKATYTFTVTMGTKNLTSNANITYSAGGKSYTAAMEDAVITYGTVKLSASLAADKKGGEVGETLKLTLKLKNTGKSDYENVTVTDALLGTVFTGVTVPAGETVTQEKEISIAQSASYQFTVTGSDPSGATVSISTDVVTVTAVDPAKTVALDVSAQVDTPTIYILPDVVTFTVSVTNVSEAEATNVSVSASGVTLYTFSSILPGETKSFVRDVQVEMGGNFRFDATTTDQLGETVTFSSDLVKITKASPTATPSQVPMATPVLPEKEAIPTHDGLAPWVDAAQNTLGVARWVFLGLGVACIALIVVGAVSRMANAAKSAQASDHLERDGYRDYTQAVPAKKRHVMPEDETADAPAYEPAPVAEEAPAPEAEPVAEEEAAVVDDAMSSLYPEAAQADDSATYQRRRRSADEE